MGCSPYFIVLLVLFSSLALSPGSAATGELPHQRDNERDSKVPYRVPIYVPICRRHPQNPCPPPTSSPTTISSTKP